VHRAIQGQGDPGQRRIVGRTDGERVDVEAAAREQAGDPGQDARLVLDEDREDVLARCSEVAGRLELVEDVKAALVTPGPVVVDVRVTREENVYPMIPAGQAARDMVG